MRKNLKAKTLESLSSVLPITALVLLLSFTLAPDMPVGTLMMFLLGAILLIVGMGLFSLGADMAMMPMGDSVGGEVVRLGKRSVWPMLAIVLPHWRLYHHGRAGFAGAGKPGARRAGYGHHPDGGGRRWRVPGDFRAAHPVRRSLPSTCLLMVFYILVFLLAAYCARRVSGRGL